MHGAARNPSIQNPEILTQGDQGEDPSLFSPDHVVGATLSGTRDTFTGTWLAGSYDVLYSLLVRREMLRVVKGKAGTIFCFQNGVWHRALPNYSAIPRAITYFQYVLAECFARSLVQFQFFC